MEGLLQSGTTPVLEFVLETNDTLPGLFEGRRPCLLEKILNRVSDKSFSLEHRQTCLRWILRQHAMQCHEGDEMLLSDCWTQLLPREEDELEIVRLKIKALGSCLSSNIGDENTICDSFVTWDGFLDTRRLKLRGSYNTFMYGLRILQKAITEREEAGLISFRLQASLVSSLLHALSTQPDLVLAVDEVLDAWDDDVATLFLRAFEGLLASLDGQFDVLREDPHNCLHPSANAKVKASLLSRASSLSGMVRGISFKLGRLSTSYAGENCVSFQWEILSFF